MICINEYKVHAFRQRCTDTETHVNLHIHINSCTH